MSAAAAVLYAPVLAVSLIASPPHLTARSWVFLAGTAVLQTGYFVFLLRAYRLGDLSAVYPSAGARAPCWPRWAASPYSASGPAPPGWPASACWWRG